MKKEDIEGLRTDRAVRAQQEVAKKAAGEAKRGRLDGLTLAGEDAPGKKRGRKRKSVAFEDALSAMQEADTSGASAEAARISEALIDLILETWRAPVAKMW